MAQRKVDLTMLLIPLLARITRQLERLEKWGAKGGKARARALGPHRRRQIAKQAAEARWRKHA